MEHYRIIVILLTLAVATVFLVFFNRRCEKKFAFKFFSLQQYRRLCIAVFLLFAGGAISLKHTSSADVIGLILLFAGGGVLWWALFDNFRKTNLGYGLVGTVLQLGLFFMFFATGMFVLLMAGAIIFLICSAIQPVFVVNRKS